MWEWDCSHVSKKTIKSVLIHVLLPRSTTAQACWCWALSLWVFQLQCLTASVVPSWFLPLEILHSWQTWCPGHRSSRKPLLPRYDAMVCWMWSVEQFPFGKLFSCRLLCGSTNAGYSHFCNSVILVSLSPRSCQWTPTVRWSSRTFQIKWPLRSLDPCCWASQTTTVLLLH